MLHQIFLISSVLESVFQQNEWNDCIVIISSAVVPADHKTITALFDFEPLSPLTWMAIRLIIRLPVCGVGPEDRRCKISFGWGFDTVCPPPPPLSASGGGRNCPLCPPGSAAYECSCIYKLRQKSGSARPLRRISVSGIRQKFNLRPSVSICNIMMYSIFQWLNKTFCTDSWENWTRVIGTAC